MKWLGQIGLNPLTVKGHISLENVKSTTLASFFVMQCALRRRPGNSRPKLTARSIWETRPRELQFQNLSLLLEGIALALPDEPAPFLKLPDARMTGARLDLTEHKIDFGVIALQGGGMRLAINDKGVTNLQRTAEPSVRNSKNEKNAAKGKQPSAGKKVVKPWTFHLGGFALSGFAVDYEDQLCAPGRKAEIRELKAHFAAEAKTGSERPSLQVKDVMLRASDIRAGFRDAGPAIHINLLKLDKGSADLTQKKLNAALIAIEGGATQVDQNIDGTLNLAQLFSMPQKAASAKQPDTAEVQLPGKAAAKQNNGKTPTQPETSAATPQFLVDRISLSGMQVTLWDRKARGDQPILNVDDLTATAAHVDGHSPMPFELGVGIREGGRIKAAGTLDPIARSLPPKSRPQRWRWPLSNPISRRWRPSCSKQEPSPPKAPCATGSKGPKPKPFTRADSSLKTCS